MEWLEDSVWYAFRLYIGFGAVYICYHAARANLPSFDRESSKDRREAILKTIGGVSALAAIVACAASKSETDRAVFSNMASALMIAIPASWVGANAGVQDAEAKRKADEARDAEYERTRQRLLGGDADTK